MKNSKLILKYLLTGVLTIGVLISVGLMSFSGLILINPSLYFAILAFFLSGCIDAEVYRQNIFSGTEELQLMGKEGMHKLIIQALEQWLKEAKKNQGTTIECPFIKDYLAQKEIVASFSNASLTPEEEEQEKFEKKRLLRMQKAFVQQVLYLSTHDHPNHHADLHLDVFIKQIKVCDALPNMRRKIWLLRFSWPINILAGAGTGFVTASAMKTALIILGLKFAFVLSATALSALIWPIAIIAAIGYVFMMYHTICDMLCNDRLNKWRKAIIKWFGYDKDNDTTLKYSLRITIVGLLLVVAVGLAVFATIATGGTWWYAVQKGAQLVPYFTAAANYIRNVLVPAVALTTLIFNLKNSLDTVKKLVNHFSLPNPLTYIKNLWNELRAKENWLQILNPFRITCNIVSLPYNSVVFIGHLIATGLTSNHLGDLNPIGTAIPCGIGEGFEDGKYIFMKKTKDEDHGNIPEFILKMILSPLLLLSAAWNCLASQLNTKTNLTAEQDKQKKVLSFLDALKHSFGYQEDRKYEKVETTVSLEWKKQEINMRFAKEEKRLDNVSVGKESANSKKNILAQLKQQMLPEQPPNSTKDEIVISEDVSTTNQKETTNKALEITAPSSKIVTIDKFVKIHATKLKHYRFFPTEQTHTEKFARKIARQYPEYFTPSPSLQ